jgi:putative transposase
MPFRRYKPEQIVTLLRQVEVGIANGKTTPQACNEVEITVQTHNRWRKEYGGLKLD